MTGTSGQSGNGWAASLQNRRPGWVLPAVTIVAAAVIVYLPAMSGGFLWDDDVYIDDEPQYPDSHLVKADDGLYHFWFTAETTDYWPVTFTAFWVQFRLWGMNPTGYHMVNILLHALGSLLLWRVLRRLKVPGAYLAALVFAVHPVCVASVAWISELKNMLSLAFYLLAALAYVRFLEQGRARWYPLALAAFAFSLLSKTSGVMLPVALLGMVWWVRRRIGIRDLLQAAPFFVMSLVASVVTIVFEIGHASAGYAYRQAGLAERLAAAGWAVWFYIYKTLVPIRLSMIYPLHGVDAGAWYNWLPLAALPVCFALGWRYRKSWGQAVLLGVGFHVLNLLPIVGLVDTAFMQYSLVSDHFQHIGIIGTISAVVALAWRFVIFRRGKLSPVGATLAGAVVLVLGILTWQRASVFSSQETLWKDVLAKNPKAWAAHNNLGQVDYERGDFEAAIEHYKKALEARGDFARAHNNWGAALCNLAIAERNRGLPEREVRRRFDEALVRFAEASRIAKLEFVKHRAHYNIGRALVELGRYEGAVENYTRALNLKSYLPKSRVHNGLGDAQFRLGRYDEAIKSFQRALSITPGHGIAQRNLDLAEGQVRRLDEAIRRCRKAVERDPESVAGHIQLAQALVARGKTAEASVHVDEAVRLEPKTARQMIALGGLLAGRGDFRKAVAQYARAIDVAPNDPSPRSALAWQLATCPRDEVRDGKRAVELAEKAAEMTNDEDAGVLDSLAAAYAAAGRFPEAVRVAEKAIRLARASGQVRLAQGCRRRLDLYRANRPYRRTSPRP